MPVRLLRSYRVHTAITLTLSCAVSFVLSPVHATEDEKAFPGIEALMGQETFVATGLNRLTDEELRSLNQWLLHYTANEAPILQKTVAEVKEESDKDIVSHIDGTFTGWQGKTVFRLKNGQQWQQRHSGTWKTHLDNPKITISRNFFGFYQMEIEGTQRVMGVKRIK